MTEYKLTDKWPEEYRGRYLIFDGSKYLIRVGFNEPNANTLEFTVAHVRNNPHLFEKVEDKKPKTRFLYGDLVEMVGGEEGEVRPIGERDKLEIAEKKARAGEELERKVRVLSDIDNRQFPFRHYLVEAGKEYREAVK